MRVCVCVRCWWDVLQVYGILVTQLLVFFGGIGLAVETASIRNFIQSHAALLWVAYVLM